jgi:hypothetical protein
MALQIFVTDGNTSMPPLPEAQWCAALVQEGVLEDQQSLVFGFHESRGGSHP